MNCEYCGREFAAQRSTARFCSSNCRVYAFRSGSPAYSVTTSVTTGGIPEQMQKFAEDHNLTPEEAWFRVIELASAKAGPVTPVTDDQPRRVLRLPDGTETTFAATSDNWHLCKRILELEEENKELKEDVTAQVRGLTDAELAALKGLADAERIAKLEAEVEALQWAEEELDDMQDKLDTSRREMREARYTMPPKDLKELFYLAEQAASHGPNWPDGWPIGRKKWRDDARAQLAEAFRKLGRKVVGC